MASATAVGVLREVRRYRRRNRSPKLGNSPCGTCSRWSLAALTRSCSFMGRTPLTGAVARPRRGILASYYTVSYYREATVSLVHRGLCTVHPLQNRQSSRLNYSL